MRDCTISYIVPGRKVHSDNLEFHTSLKHKAERVYYLCFPKMITTFSKSKNTDPLKNLASFLIVENKKELLFFMRLFFLVSLSFLFSADSLTDEDYKPRLL